MIMDTFSVARHKTRCIRPLFGVQYAATYIVVNISVTP